jgi:alkanesulfonate monooxygenase SsuD/methylene tetrahydromethanopterin reductase-like flavin-dependent oxidoreductase (luciferase family)
VNAGICVANIGSYADPRAVVRLAVAAESAGWQALFVWDHLGFVWGAPSGDPWVILSAVASATSELRIGTAVTPIARRRPHVLAETVATLDVLSGGRVVFGAGLGGVPREFTAFGEPGDDRQRAALLDEGLDLLRRLWAGERVTHHGLYTVDDVTLAPTPEQARVPIWIGGNSPAALRRAARWDGWIADTADQERMTMGADGLSRRVATIRSHRPGDEPFDVALLGYSAPDEAGLWAAYERAGATWWLESVHDQRGDPGELLTRVAAGPSR